MDLLDWHRGTLSSRRLKVLIQHLPARDSAVHHELHGEAADWSVTDYLLAGVADHLAVANWMFEVVHQGEEGSPPAFPELTPRPVDTDTGDTEVESPAESESGFPRTDKAGLVTFFSL